MIYLDTHVVVWLYAGLADKLSSQATELINDNALLISPLVSLELQYLYEIGRITAVSETILADLSKRIGLQFCSKPFMDIVHQSLAMSWTRDPFDRLIVAQAAVGNDILLSKDERIQANYALARW